MIFFLALAAAALGGFISLSYEILWYRAISIASGATAAAFGLLLGFYLLGVAAGAWIAGMRCRDSDAGGDHRLLLRTAWFFLIANGVGADRLAARGFGETQPVETNDTLEGRARNRRVELSRECP